MDTRILVMEEDCDRARTHHVVKPGQGALVPPHDDARDVLRDLVLDAVLVQGFQVLMRNLKNLFILYSNGTASASNSTPTENTIKEDQVNQCKGR